MSRSYKRNLNTATLITLCPDCLKVFRSTEGMQVKRAAHKQRIKDTCTYCQVLTGFDYYVQPAAHMDPNRREAKAYVAAAED